MPPAPSATLKIVFDFDFTIPGIWEPARNCATLSGMGPISGLMLGKATELMHIN
jgi:hypothetical protein